MPKLALTYLKNIIDVLLPKTCLGCGEKINSEVLCRLCQDKISFLPKKINLKLSPHRNSKIISCLDYKPPLSHLIQLFKYRNYIFLDDFFCNLMQKYLKAIEFRADEFDVITAVPSSTTRKRQRGYNQSYQLAKRLSIYLKMPLKDDIISCISNKPQQAKLSKQARQNNIKNNFVAGNVEKANIILIDDVLTTGSTISECIRTLHNKGANKVVAITLAKQR
jgi:competence protein ComFC